MVFSIISDKNLDYMFQLRRSYESWVVHMYTGISVASSSQPTTKANQK